MSTQKCKVIAAATVWAAILMGCNGKGGRDDIEE
jgi:hypothetical protein